MGEKKNETQPDYEDSDITKNFWQQMESSHREICHPVDDTNNEQTLVKICQQMWDEVAFDNADAVIIPDKGCY